MPPKRIASAATLTEQLPETVIAASGPNGGQASIELARQLADGALAIEDVATRLLSDALHDQA